MTNKKLPDTAMATVLLCSHLALKNKNVKPYTTVKWYELGKKILASSIKNPGNLFGLSINEIQDALSISQAEATRIFSLLSRGADVAFELERLEKKAIFVVTKSQPEYPARLKEILSKLAPPVLFYCGDLSLAQNEGIAIVGSRRIDEDGENFAKELVSKAVEQNFTIFSGGADGVDSVSATTAVELEGNAVEFLSSEMENKILNPATQQSISDGKKLLLSEVLPNAKFFVGNAMARNKYVYALARATFVIASDYEKGGTWNGAEESLRRKWGKVFVWNTNAYSGNKALIEKGASEIPNLNDISFKDLISVDTPAKKSTGEVNLFETLS